MFEIAVSENIRPGEFLMRLNMAYNFNRLLFMHSSLIDLINIKAMLVLFSLQAKKISFQLLRVFHLLGKKSILCSKLVHYLNITEIH